MVRTIATFKAVTCIDLSRVSLAVIYLVCLDDVKKRPKYGRIAFSSPRDIVLSA